MFVSPCLYDCHVIHMFIVTGWRPSSKGRPMHFFCMSIDVVEPSYCGSGSCFFMSWFSMTRILPLRTPRFSSSRKT